jgi:hypothetical protein
MKRMQISILFELRKMTWQSEQLVITLRLLPNLLGRFFIISHKTDVEQKTDPTTYEGPVEEIRGNIGGSWRRCQRRLRDSVPPPPFSGEVQTNHILQLLRQGKLVICTEKTVAPINGDAYSPKTFPLDRSERRLLRPTTGPNRTSY